MAAAAPAGIPVPGAKPRKSWVITIIHSDEGVVRAVWTRLQELFALPEQIYFTRGLAQLERAPTTGTLHVHALLYFRKAQRHTGVKEILKCPTANCQPPIDETAAERYVSKEESRVEGPIKCGNWSETKGLRMAASDVVKLACLKSARELLAEEPDVAERRWRLVDLARKFAPPRMRDHVDVRIIWGATAVGKSHYVHSTHKCGEVYSLPPTVDRQIWFDGYDGELVMLMDEFDPDMWSLPFLNQVLDKWPVRLRTKGGFTSARWEAVFIIANSDPTSWFLGCPSGILHAFRRRVSHVWHKQALGEEPHWLPPAWGAMQAIVAAAGAAPPVVLAPAPAEGAGAAAGAGMLPPSVVLAQLSALERELVGSPPRLQPSKRVKKTRSPRREPRYEPASDSE